MKEEIPLESLKHKWFTEKKPVEASDTVNER